MIGGYKVVDGHVHTFPTEEVAGKIIESFNKAYSIEFENPGTGSISDVLKNMNKTGIDYTVMANFSPAKILHNNNLWTISVSEENKSLIPLVSFHPDLEGKLGVLLESYIKKGAKGIKIHPMAQGFEPIHKRMDEVYEACRETSFPIVFHCGRVSNARLNEYADLDMILPVIEKYPEVPFILTHMVDGNIEHVLMLAENYKNVYFDTSIVITGYPSIAAVNEPSWLDDGAVVDIINRIGAERILFGSDYPWGSPNHDIDRFLKMNLTGYQKELILGVNSMKVFNIV
ncbi:MAG: amidohydrolase family protein [Clostridia bacterium]|nr:amidohydrolase family protein [Clostridia bacterium]